MRAVECGCSVWTVAEQSYRQDPCVGMTHIAGLSLQMFLGVLFGVLSHRCRNPSAAAAVLKVPLLHGFEQRHKGAHVQLHLGH